MTTINVTKSFLPPIEEYTAYLNQIWESHWLTNNGPLTCRLENELKEQLGVRHLFFVNNGTIALQIAIKALDLRPGDEIITTPFSYVATTSSLVWEGCKPVFVDIDPDTLCLDPTRIEAAITSRTRAIMPVHVFGNPCEVEMIEEIARRKNLRVIYDAAHAFGVNYHLGQSVLRYGDISTLSFHATKLFHTVEGGAVTTEDDELAHKISYLRNFGHNGPEKFFGLGINGKSSEFHAAMGLCVLPRINELIAARRQITEQYDEAFKGLSQIRRPRMFPGIRYNFSYYPVIFESEALLLEVREALNRQNIIPRRYFYPSLTTLPYVERAVTPVADSISARILCLPLYFDLEAADIKRITATIVETVTTSSKMAANF